MPQHCVVTFCNEYSVRCTCKYVQMFVSWYMYFDSWLVHWSRFHYKSLVNSYLIFSMFNETLLMRTAWFITLVSNYLNRQTILSLYNTYFRSHFSSRVVSLWSLPSRDHTLDPNRMVLVNTKTLKQSYWWVSLKSIWQQ